ncbi:hypothetical protein F511_45027 [Dorcoceras hygrometricum]|uniref:Uncharacterized protein n=1 Tax=Dorcoceras hygrometricum TaxID=472368 RepID=A0A2Z7A4M1_9LAMI|nr:hypothetical protein F511_45027 [Dorcoceras hygrometricum]
MEISLESLDSIQNKKDSLELQFSVQGVLVACGLSDLVAARAVVIKSSSRTLHVQGRMGDVGV